MESEARHTKPLHRAQEIDSMALVIRSTPWGRCSNMCQQETAIAIPAEEAV